jgi:hypothetical protein
MAAPTIISKGTANAAISAPITPSYPASPQANDIIWLLVISHQPVSIGVINTPSGFTEAAQGTYQNSSSVNQGRAALFWRRSDGTETGTVSVSRTGDTGADGVFFGQMYLERGVQASGNPYDQVIPRYGPGNATVTWDAVTVSGSERTLLAFCAQADDSPGVATPSTYTRTVAIDVTTSGTDGQVSLSDKRTVSSDGSVTAANGETLGWATFHVSTPPTVAATIVPIGQATETDTSQPITRLKTKAIGQASETDTATAITIFVPPGTFRLRKPTGGSAPKDGSVLKFPPVAGVLIGQAHETDTATAMQFIGGRYPEGYSDDYGAGDTGILLGQPSELDTAQPIAALLTTGIDIGQAQETDQALPITPFLAPWVTSPPTSPPTTVTTVPKTNVTGPARTVVSATS